MRGKTLMVQGTASNVGKSLVVAALCRIFRDEGVRVAPFKAVNMALNSAVTAEGREMGRAQAMQAEAARIPARVEMNPILLKPEPDGRAQLVLMGEPAGGHDFQSSGPRREELSSVVESCLESLREEYELVIIEGAGSPAEVNLRGRDLANMHVAELADAPVLLVGDIDRGGVFASLVGTLELLECAERARVKGLLVNKFRGEARHLGSGIRFLEEKTGVPVVGVLPFLRELGIPDEDGVDLEPRLHRARASGDELEVAILRFPFLSNHDEFLPLEREPGVVVRFIDNARDILGADLVIVPGSKSTRRDLAWLRDRRMDRALRERATRSAPILGICGGCQMLGERIDDPSGVEGEAGSVEAIGLLALETRFRTVKRTTRVLTEVPKGSFLGAPSEHVPGYEIHMGRIRIRGQSEGATRVRRRGAMNVEEAEGARSDNGAVVGTMIHGLFEDAALRASMLGELRLAAGLRPARGPAGDGPAEPLDELARRFRDAMNMDALAAMIGDR